jgi:excisionase family DNA binding protein
MTPKKTKPRPSRKPRKRAPKSLPAAIPEVLTLAEAAAYLRVTEEEVGRLVGPAGLPGRLIGDQWRFLKSAIQAWLATPPARSGKEALLSQAGAMKDDPDLNEMLENIYKDRGRPMVEEPES